MDLEVKIPVYDDDYNQKEHKEIELVIVEPVYQKRNCIRFELKVKDKKDNIIFLIDKYDLKSVIGLF
jgi:hypothetical protein